MGHRDSGDSVTTQSRHGRIMGVLQSRKLEGKASIYKTNWFHWFREVGYCAKQSFQTKGLWGGGVTEGTHGGRQVGTAFLAEDEE